MVNEILVQAGYYFITLVIGILIIAMVQKGFFGAFWKVRTSFGRLVLCKFRTLNRDYFLVGAIEEGFLVVKTRDGVKRIGIKDGTSVYRCLGMNWADIDEETNQISNAKYEAQAGYDAIKYNNLYLRALYKPPTDDMQNKILIGLMVLILLLVVGAVFGIYKTSYSIEHMTIVLNDIASRLPTSANVIPAK